MNRSIRFFAFAALLLSTCNQQPEATPPGATTKQTVERAQQIEPMQVALPEHLLIVLRKEMRLIESGMGELLGHLAAGRAQKAAAVATNIKKSFILKQSLGQDDLKQLVGLLPPEFVKMDRQFHGNAGELAAAAGQNNFRTAIKIYSTMSEACVTCHAQYAAERFPALAQ